MRAIKTHKMPPAGVSTYLWSGLSLHWAGPVGSPSVGMPGTGLLSHPADNTGAKLTVLKEGGGGRTGRVSMMVTRFSATL